MPRWGDEPVTFDRYDTLHSAMAKLEAADGGWPFVVLKSDCRIASNVLTYKLLSRTSERFAAPIAVVTGNPNWRRLAREHGLKAYGSIGSLRRARRRSILSLPESLVDALVSSLHLSLSKEGWVATILLLAAASVAAFFLVPVMRVTIRTPVETLSREFNVRVDVSATTTDAASVTVPGRTLEHRFTATDFVETTGEKKVGKERARGEVTIINSSPGLVVLPAGTILSTGSGDRFSTTTEATVGPYVQAATGTPAPAQGIATGGPSPAAGGRGTPLPGATATATRVPTATATLTRAPTPTATTSAGPAATPGRPPAVSGIIVRVPAVAVEPGEKGNAPALAISKIEGDAFRGLTVFNERPFAGGTDVKARVGSPEDRARLKEILFGKVQSQALSELTLRVRQSESLISHSMQVRIEREEYDKGPDEETDRLRATAYVMATAVAFLNQDLNSVVERSWRASTPRGYRALAGAINLSPPEVVEAGSRAAGLRVKVAGRVERVLEADEVAQGLRGMSVLEARDRLTRLESPLRLENLEMWPSWAPRAYRVEVLTVQ